MCLVRKSRDYGTAEQNPMNYSCYMVIEQLTEVNTHCTRQEIRLFPMLEGLNVTGPSLVMWPIHDSIRSLST